MEKNSGREVPHDQAPVTTTNTMTEDDVVQRERALTVSTPKLEVKDSKSCKDSDQCGTYVTQDKEEGVIVTQICKPKVKEVEDELDPQTLTEQEKKKRRMLMKQLDSNRRKMARARAEVAKTDWFKGKNAMDEQTRHAHFESLRRMPGVSRLKPSHNKKLYVVHKDLQRQCDKEVQRHQFDARASRSEINRQQQVFHKKRETLRNEQQKCYEASEHTRAKLDKMEHGHEMALRTKINAVPMRTTHASIVRAIERLEMPRAMKDKLQMQTYTTRILNEV